MTVPSRAGSRPRSGGLLRDPRILGCPDGRAKVALVVLAIAPMSVHLLFFRHFTTGPDNTNMVMAPASAF